MEVMLPGNKVCAVEVVITPDPIKLIKPQLIIMEGWREREKIERDGEKMRVVDSAGSPSESLSLMRLEGRHTEQTHNLLN